MVGVGSAQTDSLSNTTGRHFENHRDNFFNNGRNEDGNEYVVVQPSIQLEGNLIRYMKFFVGANYRLAFNSSTTTTLPKNTLQGVSVNLGLKLGLFDFYIGKREKIQN